MALSPLQNETHIGPKPMVRQVIGWRKNLLLLFCQKHSMKQTFNDYYPALRLKGLQTLTRELSICCWLIQDSLLEKFREDSVECSIFYHSGYYSHTNFFNSLMTCINNKILAFCCLSFARYSLQPFSQEVCQVSLSFFFITSLWN